MSESNLGRKIMMAVSNIGSRVFRFNTALSWAGEVHRYQEPKTVILNSSDIIIRNARPIHSGFEGAPDYTGWTPLVVTQEMVGKKIAVSTWIEVKVPGSKTSKDRAEKQDNFILQVNNCGGIGIKAYSEEDAIINIKSFQGK